MMQFAVLATDRPGHVDLRERTRPQHRLYLRNPGTHEVRVLLAGPTMDADGNHMNGTLMVVEAKSVEAVSGFVADDPYAKAGLFERIEIRPWKCGLGAIQVER
jgi:uncharacterized protein YciI